MTDLFKDTIPSILQTKKEVITQENERDYVPFITNRALSFHHDCILYANQMNLLPNMDPLLQYHFLINTVRSYKRPFQKWQKRVDNENLEAIKEYYSFSNEKAKEAITLLTNDQLDEIKKNLNKGGLNAKSKRTYRGNAT